MCFFVLRYINKLCMCLYKLTRVVTYVQASDANQHTRPSSECKPNNPQGETNEVLNVAKMEKVNFLNALVWYLQHLTADIVRDRHYKAWFVVIDIINPGEESSVFKQYLSYHWSCSQLVLGASPRRVRKLWLVLVQERHTVVCTNMEWTQGSLLERSEKAGKARRSALTISKIC